MYIGDLVEDTSGSASELVEWADIVIIQRLLLSEVQNSIFYWRSKGKPIAADLDDAYLIMPSSVASHRFWKQGIVGGKKDGKDVHIQMTYKPDEQLVWGVKLCNALISPSKVICEDWKAYTPNTFLVPNYIDSSLYIPHRRVPGDGTIVIGWGGSFSHLDSWNGSKIIPALHRILMERKNVRLSLAGGDPRIYGQFHRQRSQVMIHSWVPHDKWPETLAEFDIGVIPLSGEYDQRRSWIKPLEYSIMGIPWVGSSNRMTDEFSTMGTLVRNKSMDWYEALIEAIDDIEGRRAAMFPWMHWAEDQDVRANVHNLISTYQQIIDLGLTRHE
jgi:glycosyltransferase involved in cell wall biosynthesis